MSLESYLLLASFLLLVSLQLDQGLFFLQLLVQQLLVTKLLQVVLLSADVFLHLIVPDELHVTLLSDQVSLAFKLRCLVIFLLPLRIEHLPLFTLLVGLSLIPFLASLTLPIEHLKHAFLECLLLAALFFLSEQFLLAVILPQGREDVFL